MIVGLPSGHIIGRIQRDPPPHRCSPPFAAKVDDVWECACGERLVAVLDQPGWVKWRRLKRLERRRVVRAPSVPPPCPGTDDRDVP